MRVFAIIGIIVCIMAIGLFAGMMCAFAGEVDEREENYYRKRRD